MGQMHSNSLPPNEKRSTSLSGINSLTPTASMGAAGQSVDLLLGIEAISLLTSYVTSGRSSNLSEPCCLHL